MSRAWRCVAERAPGWSSAAATAVSAEAVETKQEQLPVQPINVDDEE